MSVVQNWRKSSFMATQRCLSTSKQSSKIPLTSPSASGMSSIVKGASVTSASKYPELARGGVVITESSRTRDRRRLWRHILVERFLSVAPSSEIVDRQNRGVVISPRKDT